MKLLIVCFGNICRGPMAYGLARKIAAEKGLALEIQTARMDPHRKGPVTRLAVEAMAQVDVDISQVDAAPISQGLLEWADAAVAVEPDLAIAVRLQYPEAEDKVLHLETNVPDPHRPGAALADYVACRDLLEQGLLRLPIWHEREKPKKNQRTRTRLNKKILSVNW